MNQVRHRHRYMHQKQGGDKRWFGFALLMIGVVVLLNKFMDFDYHSLWPWILIGIGVIVGLKNKFSNNAPYILIAVGVAHVIPVFYIMGVSSKALLVPAALIGLGLLFIFRPGSKKKTWSERCESGIRTVTNNENVLNVDVTFGGHKEIVTSKDFKGGNISTTFGGSEINLMNADSTEKTLTLNLKVSFGGVELIVPSHWQIKNEISNTLGNVEDNRNVYTYGGEQKEIITLVLTGTCNFGNIEIKSY